MKKKFTFWLKATGLGVLILVLGVLLVGWLMKALAPDVPPPGQLVDVGGFRLHIHCSGQLRGAAPVLIEAGLGVSAAYYHWIQEGLEPSTKVCSYDRAGLGFSEESHRSREPAEIVRQLHVLLEKAGFERPFVFAGHSIAGILIREYVSQYPDEVAGVAFLDGSNPDQTRALGLEKIDVKAQAERGLKVYRMLVNSGLSRLYDPALAPVRPFFPETVIDELQYTARDRQFDAVLAEFDGMGPYTNRPRPADDFGDRPTVAIQAGEKWDPSVIPPGVDVEKVSAGWSSLQRQNAALSTRGRYVVVKDSNHMSLVYDQKYAAQAVGLIREVLKAQTPAQAAPVMPQR